jgi:hypothetical protein
LGDAASSLDTVPEVRCVTTAVGAAVVTGNEVEPMGTGDPPSGFEIVAVRVAVPTVRAFTTTLVLVVNVPAGLTTAAGLVMLREMGVVLFVGLTVAFVVAVCPTRT